MTSRIRQTKPTDGYPVEDGILRSPTLTKLAETTARFTGMGLVAVFPEKEGGQQVVLSGHSQRPQFCGMIQSSREGAQHCKICHMLMAVAASRDGVRERRCHAGLSTLVAPTTTLAGNKLAVLSTCVFIAGSRAQQWKLARQRGLQLKLDLTLLREAFDALPELGRDQLALAHALMEVVAEVLAEHETHEIAEGQRAALCAAAEPKLQIQTALRQALQGSRRRTLQDQTAAITTVRTERAPILIKIVADLIEHRPNLPYSGNAIAAAARITPCHFSTLFRRWTGQNFMAFLNEKRLACAMRLLQDPTLSISEVAGQAGYRDANYFSRRFKQATHKSPLQWRNS